jgi:hypothetical protein
VQSPQRWNDDAAWKLDYNNLAKLTPEDWKSGARSSTS